jgi:hypothetical protein
VSTAADQATPRPKPEAISTWLDDLGVAVTKVDL